VARDDLHGPAPIDGVGPSSRRQPALGLLHGPDSGAAFTWGAFDLTFGTTIGFRELGVPLVGFDPVPCRGGSCPPSATQNSFFLRPRLAMGIHHSAWAWAATSLVICYPIEAGSPARTSSRAASVEAARERLARSVPSEPAQRDARDACS